MPRESSSYVVKLVAGGLLAMVASAAVAESWPHWRGPRFDGTSRAESLPERWSQDENVAWRLELPGAAASTPVIWGDRIFLTGTEGKKLVAMAVDTGGEILWRREVDQGAYEFKGGMAQFAIETNPASPSPVTDGEHVWTLFGTGALVAFDRDGKQVWQVDLKERYGELSLYFGLSASPFLHDGKLYLQLLNTNDQRVVALDAETGAEVWSIQRPTDARAECLHSYASPLVYGSGKGAYLLIHGADYLTAHDPADGRELWRHGGLNPEDGYNPSLRLVASPVVHDGLLVLPSAKNGPVYGIDPAKARAGGGDITGAEASTRWHLERGTPDVPTPLVQDGLVYLSRENGRLTTVDGASGEVLYAERVHTSTHRGSPLYADGKVYLVGTDGTVSVVEAGREYRLLAKNQIDERIAASLAVADGTLYLRSYEALYAIREPDPATGEAATSR